MRECRDCGLFQELPPLPEGARARCVRCGATLAWRRSLAIGPFLASAIAGLALWLWALPAPFMVMRIAGRLSRATLATAPHALDAHGAATVSAVVFAVLLAVPPLRFASWIAVLASATQPPAPAWARRLHRWVRVLGPWAMIDVFLTGVLVAHGRLSAFGPAEVGLAFAALAGSFVTLAVLEWLLDADALWERLWPERLAGGTPEPPSPARIGCEACGLVASGLVGCDFVARGLVASALVARPGARTSCPRCLGPLRARKANSVQRTWALVAAAAILYVPSNVLPVLSFSRLAQKGGGPKTILGGVVDLVDAHLWGLAGIVFLASVLIPVLKLLSLGIMLVLTHRRSSWRLRARSRLFRVVEAIGRWSMVDIFVLTTLVALVQAGTIAVVLPEDGATAFCAVVVLTMLAAASFDPRLMWDAGTRSRSER